MSQATCRICLALLALSWLTPIDTPRVLAEGVIVPDRPTPTMPLEDIRIGMKGYGLTVFQGTKIEPFNVVVVSVIPNSSPTRSVIWIRCDDPRMVESGPVQGMSGSPIFLWGEDEPQELGKGGKLIGAFAFGYSDSQQCMVGVQPIGYMRDAATRITRAQEGAGASSSGGSSTRSVIELLDRLEQLPSSQQGSALGRVRLKAIRDVLLRASGRGADDLPRGAARATLPGPRAGAQAAPLMLPMPLGSPDAVRAFAPLLEPMGILGVSANAAPIAGSPPYGIDAGSVSLQPGSVLAIPLAYGDLDLSASGTVTDVLPGGEVLAFGHPMFGLGGAKVPMATGYVHFVMSRRSTSFKSGGTLVPQGTLVRDEGAGVVGIAEKRYTAAPVDITVNMLGQPSRQYHYEIVNEPMLSAMLTAVVTFNSIKAVHALPMENTTRLRAVMRFSGDRELKLDTLSAGGTAVNPVMEMLPALSVMVQNPYESLEVESVSVTIDVEAGNRVGTITGARLDRAEVAPGDTVGVSLDIQHYAGKIEHRRIEVKVPDDLDEGDYPLTVSGASTYAALKLSTKPHLMVTRSIDDLADFLQETMNFRSDAIYTALQVPSEGLAVGRTEMLGLPSSRAAILQSPTTTDAIPFTRIVDQTFDADIVVNGQVNFTLNVRKP